MSSPERKEEIWKQETDVMERVAQQAEERCEGLFSRIVDRRADYFADVGDLSADFEINDFPTRRYDTLLQSLGFSLVSLSTLPTNVLLIEEQPTDTVPLIDQPTSVLPEVSALPSRREKSLAREVGGGGESYGVHLSNLLKRSGTYALASVVSPLVSLALSPFLARHLLLADYGELTVLMTAIALAAGVSQLGLGSAFFRVYGYDYEAEGDRESVLSMTLFLLIGCAFPLALCECVAAPWLSLLLLGNSDQANIVRVAALVVLLQNLTVPGFAWMRAENQAVFFARLSVANVLVNLGMTVLLVGVWHLGIGGSLLATGCGYALVLLCTLPPLLRRMGQFRLRVDIAHALLSFGFPNTVSFATAWVLQLADRFLLAHMRSFGETATYSVAYTLGGALSVVVLSPFSLAWPSTLFLLARRQDARQIFRLVFRWYSLFLLFMAYALSLAGQFALTVFFPTGYRSAGIVIPLVALSTMFYGFYNYLTLGMNMCKKLWYAVLFLASAALINVGADFCLIPHYGSPGAALATLIAYALLALETYLLNQRIYPVSFEVGLVAAGLGLITGCYLCGVLLAQGHSFWISWTIESLFLLLCGTGLFTLGWLWTIWHCDQKEKTPGAISSEQPSVRPVLSRVCMHVLMPVDRDVRVEREASTLIERGYQVTVVDLVRGEEDALVGVNKAIRVRHLPVPRRFHEVRFKKWATLRAVLLFLRGILCMLRIPADIYHAHDFNALPATYVVARLKRRPLIYDAHELPLAEISVKARWMQILSRIVLRHIVPRCTAVISVSPPILRVLQEEYAASRVALVRNIPWYQSASRNQMLHKHLGLPPETRILLFQGYLGANRALDLLVRSARFLHAPAVIVLLGPPRPEVQVVLDKLIADEGVADRVKILPPVHYSELLRWTASADVGLALFRPDYSLNVRWCLPNKLFEYLMAGLPVLASPLDAVREVLEKQQVGRVVEDMTPEGIAQAMNALLADPSTLAQMRRNALELVQRSFCWEKEREHLLDLYAQISSSLR